MSVSRCPSNYLYDPATIYDSLQWRNGYTFSEAAKALGFDLATGHYLTADLMRFAHRQRVDGTPTVRQQKNNADHVTCLLYTVRSELSAKAAADPNKETYERFIQIIRDAITLDANPVVEWEAGWIRHGAGGKHFERAKLVSLTTVHGWGADGSPHAHGHVWYTNVGRAEHDGKTYTVYDQRAFKRAFEKADLVFQASLAHRLEQDLGWNVAVENGKCVLKEELHPEVKALVGNRKREMEAWVESKGLHKTPLTMAIARVETRPEVRQSFDKHERAEAWLKELGVDARQFQTLSLDERKKGGHWGRIAEARKAQWREELKTPPPIARRSFSIRDGKIVVRDVKRFLEDTKTRSLREGHKAALKVLLATKRTADAERAFAEERKPHVKLTEKKSLKRGHFAAFLAFLNTRSITAMEEAFQRARRPRVDVPEKAKVAVTKQAAERMTAAERKELEKRAAKRGWKLTVVGERPQQEEEQRQRRGY